MYKIFLPIIFLFIGMFLIYDKQNPKMDVVANINVDIKGAVNRPGKYSLPYGTCIADLISLAGGLRFDASTKYINLAKKLEDEMVVVIYTEYDIENSSADLVINYCQCPTIINDGCLVNEENNKEKININLATIEELMTLNGIGKTKAQAIIDYRNTNGNFVNVEQIMNVKGIGEATYDKIKTFITV